jgi:DNA replication protein DnaC
MEPASKPRSFAEWAAERIRVAETPEFQANAAKLRAGTDAEQIQAETDRRLALLGAGIPASLWGTLADPKPTDAISSARDFLARPPACVYLVLAGPAGRGKTFAAAWTVAQREGRYALAHDLVTAGSFDPIWRELAAAPVLALDEVGAEYRNAAFDASLYALLNARHAHERKTVICTNLDAAGFMSRYCPKPDDPLRNRLATASVWVNLPGESMRKAWSDTERDEEGQP